jgi:serine/threonine protein kinase
VKALEAGDPAQIGKYRLLGRLGSGGMGQVFLGQSPGGRLVAVKLIRPDLAADIDFRVRFSREVKAARKVSGIFTAPVVDADPDGPQPWLVTAYVPGPSLADAVRAEGPLPVSSVLMLAAGLTEGISALHAAGVVHRDLKPSNVLLASDGPRIIDFGVSWAADATPVTSAGMVIGSPGFMSPEQAGGYEVGPASDVFSLGSVLMFAATGEGPFGTGPGTVLLYRVQHLEPAIDRLPEQIRPLVEQCLAKNPRHRPTTDQILAGLGSLPLAADWPLASIGQVLQVQAEPAAAVARSSADAHTLTMSPLDRGASPDVAVPPDHGPDSPGLSRYGRGRRLSRTWAVCALVVVAGLVLVLTLISHWPATAPPANRPLASSQVLGPSAVIKAF